ncbi:hypothetical protein CVS47_00611 [Microbacterium lemovicicum]|uniref:SseB protein N-terminal domain-containing protein n=2 Tax=Microbacterium lemovicicum TaxID=1072463 RepID=A0A3S9W7E3_9MICO|nr:SseB family protein [Microbacterium lemovicicum]AZS36012.1 hypothetical protein CVS47_00611 [Microbacterium lemovicicum]
MGIFSRSKRTDPTSDEQKGADATASGAADAGDSGSMDAAASGAADATASGSTETVTDSAGSAPAATVGISMSTYRGVGAPAGAPVAAEPASSGTPAGSTVGASAGASFGLAGGASGGGPAGAGAAASARPPAEAPQGAERAPGMRDNGLLQAALAELPAEPTSQQMLNAARQLLQGHVFLRVEGDARALIEAGENLPLQVATQGDAQWALAYSGGDALRASVQADGATGTSALAQPVTAVIQHVLQGPYAGLVLDHASGTSRLMLPRDLLERAVKDTTPELRIKSLLAAPRTAETAGQVVEAIAAGPVWVAASRPAEGQTPGIAEARSADGTRFLELFSHPLEVFALRPNDQPVPVKTAQLAAALRSDEGISGVLLDPAGPWIQLSREELAPILAVQE